MSDGNGLGFGLAAFESVIQVKIADGSEGEVVIVGSSDRFAELFIEGMQRVQMGSGRGHFEPAGAQELLIAAVDESGNLAADQTSGLGQIGSAAVRSSRQDGTAAMLKDLHLICDAGSLLDIKSMRAEIGEGASEGLGWKACFFRHS